MALEPRYPVAIVGPGALGRFFHARLSKVVPAALIGRDTTPLPRADWVIVLVKAYDTAAALRSARHMRPKGIVSLQNGLIGSAPQGVTTAAAYRAGKRVVPVSHGLTLLPPGFEPLARLLRRAGLPARVAHGIERERLRKLLVNVCLNPVTALFQVKNGEVRKPPYARFVEVLAHEAAPILAAEGLRLSPEGALEEVMTVAQRTANNRSSMLQDLIGGRRTEIDYLTGALLRLGRRHGVAAPTHRAFYRLIRVIEAR